MTPLDLKPYIGLFAALWVAGILLGDANGSVFEAGWAKVDITPPFTTPMAGYGARRGNQYQSVRDRLYVRAVVIGSGSEKVAIVSADLVAINRALRTEVIRQLAAKQKSFRTLLLAATHTHSGIGGYWANSVAEFATMGSFDQNTFDFLTARITEAVVKADAAKAPARIGAASANVNGFNRNRREPGGPADRELYVIRIDDQQGNPKAAIVNFAAHATALGARNLDLSADFPGALSGALEKRLAMALFTVGAVGDAALVRPPAKNAHERVDTLGQTLASKASETLERARTSAVARIKSRTVEITLPPATLYGAMGYFSAVVDPLFRRYAPASTLLQAIRINDVVLSAWPGEPVAEIGLKLKADVRAKSGRHPILIILANDYIGYIQTEKNFAQQRYETTASFFGPALAEHINSRMRDLIHSLDP